MDDIPDATIQAQFFGAWAIGHMDNPPRENSARTRFSTIIFWQQDLHKT